MKRIEPLKIKLKSGINNGIFHDSRGDVRIISQAVNAIIEKQNEIIESLNLLIKGREDKDGR